MDHTFFRDFSKLNYLSSIRPGSSAGDPQVVNLRCLQDLPDGSVSYNINYTDQWRPHHKDGERTKLMTTRQCLSEFTVAGQVSLIPRSKASFRTPTISSISDIKRPRHDRRFQTKVYIKIISFIALKRTQLILFGHYSHKPDRAYCYKSV